MHKKQKRLNITSFMQENSHNIIISSSIIYPLTAQQRET